VSELFALRLRNSLQDQPRSSVDQLVFAAPEAAVDAESVDVEIADVAAAGLIRPDFLVAVEVG